jgi:hypothetical protein
MNINSLKEQIKVLLAATEDDLNSGRYRDEGCGECGVNSVIDHLEAKKGYLKWFAQHLKEIDDNDDRPLMAGEENQQY